MSKDARGHGSDSTGSAKAAPYRAAVAGVQAAAGKFMSGLAAHQTGTLNNLKSTSQMLAEHDKIWSTRPPEGNPFPANYKQHALWELDHKNG